MTNEETILQLLSGLKSDMSDLKQDVAGLKQDVAESGSISKTALIPACRPGRRPEDHPGDAGPQESGGSIGRRRVHDENRHPGALAGYRRAEKGSVRHRDQMQRKPPLAGGFSPIS